VLSERVRQHRNPEARINAVDALHHIVMNSEASIFRREQALNLLIQLSTASNPYSRPGNRFPYRRIHLVLFQIAFTSIPSLNQTALEALASALASDALADPRLYRRVVDALVDEAISEFRQGYQKRYYHTAHIEGVLDLLSRSAAQRGLSTEDSQTIISGVHRLLHKTYGFNDDSVKFTEVFESFVGHGLYVVEAVMKASFEKDKTIFDGAKKARSQIGITFRPLFPEILEGRWDPSQYEWNNSLTNSQDPSREPRALFQRLMKDFLVQPEFALSQAFTPLWMDIKHEIEQRHFLVAAQKLRALREQGPFREFVPNDEDVQGRYERSVDGNFFLLRMEQLIESLETIGLPLELREWMEAVDNWMRRFRACSLLKIEASEFITI